MIGSVIAVVLSFLIFLGFQAQGIYTGDSGDLVTSAVIGGVPHPPGYPLYTALGWVAVHIFPWLTPSWRVTLLSSLPHAISVGLVFGMIYRLTRKNMLASIFGSAILVSNYLFFLYSITPEVFALFDLFIIVLWYLLFLWQDSRNFRFLYAACFVFGLSLSHHHVIVFFVPAIGYFLWGNRHLFRRRYLDYKQYLPYLGWFLLGLFPYIYIPIAANLDPIINWDRVVSWEAFWRLISRADYGTFVSSGSIGQTIRERWLAVVAYATFLMTDWTAIGVVLAATGLYAWSKAMRVRFISWVLALLISGPAFLFYASFPLASRFTLGTYERFLLPGYMCIAVLIGVGFAFLLDKSFEIFKPFIGASKRRTIVLLIGIVGMLYPITMGTVTMWRFWGIANDRTAENLGRDILANTPKDAILLLSQDTALFTTQYVRYVLGVRRDTAVIHAARLALPDYQIVLKKHFPRLVMPEVPQAEFLPAFVKANSTPETRVFSNISLPVGDGWYWVPRGLLYEAVPSSELPGVTDMYARAKEISAVSHDPRSGILSRYPHLMLSDVLDVYASGHIALGKTLVRADRWEEAKQEFALAVSLDGDTSIVEALELLGLTQMYMKDCEGALVSFREAKNRSFVATARHIRLESITYGECLGDVKQAEVLFSEYERLRNASEQPLESL